MAQFFLTHSVYTVTIVTKVLKHFNFPSAASAEAALPNVYMLIVEALRLHILYDLVFRAADWLTVTMETSSPLIEMDSAIIDKGTEDQLVRQCDVCFSYNWKISLFIVNL